ncbi:MAG: condensation domain-containing protein, partial [Cyanobacteriota bacterium]
MDAQGRLTLTGRIEKMINRGGRKVIPQAEPLAGDWPAGTQVFPASHAQARLWFLQQLEPGLTAYHLPALWRLSGELDLRALDQALTELLARHSPLRTSFQLEGSEVLQIIHPPAPFSLQPEALADRSPELVIEEWLAAERATPFDLSSGLLLRARLLAVDGHRHLLLINHHHIASDGWSRTVLARDLVEFYNAHRSGRPPRLQELRVRYQDYALWQRQRLGGADLQRLQHYWRSQLAGIEPLELPGDHPRPAMPSHRGGSVPVRIGPPLLGALEELCRSEGATLQMGLLALVAVLLHRYSRQADVAIGVPSWGRIHPALEPLIGLFINTLPIRTRLEAEQSFRELLRQVRATALAAYEHQELPFEQMVAALTVERDTSRNPLVQVMLQLFEQPQEPPPSLVGVALETLDAPNDACRFDLEFFLRHGPDGGLEGQLVYALDLFAADRMERLSFHFLTLLSLVLQTPDAPVQGLSLLPESERQLIESWQQGPSVERPDCTSPVVCVHEMFEQQVARTPDALALIFGDERL